MNTLEEVSSIQEMPKKETRGRPAGVQNIKTYKWDVTVFDKTTNTFKREKCITIADINEKFGVKRIVTKYRADMSMKNKENSFLARWGFIQIEKIYEPIL